MIDFWVKGTFPVQRCDHTKPRAKGIVRGSFGIIDAGSPTDRYTAPVADTSAWAYLVHRSTGQPVGLFATDELAAEAAEMAEHFGDWSRIPPATKKITDAWQTVGFYCWGHQDEVGNMVWFRRRGPYFARSIAAFNASTRMRFRASEHENGWHLMMGRGLVASFADRKSAVTARTIANELIERPGLLTDDEIVVARGMLHRALLRLGFTATKSAAADEVLFALDAVPTARAA